MEDEVVMEGTSDTDSECSHRDISDGRSSPLMAFEEVRQSVHKGFIHKSWNEIGKQRKQKEFCDVVINCQGRKFYAHKNIMAAASPYFRTLFLCDFEIEKRKGDKYWQIQLDDFSLKSVKLLVNIVYNQKFSLPEADLNCLLDFLKLAHFCQIQHLIEFTTSYLKDLIDDKSCFHIYEHASLCGIKMLTSMTTAYIRMNFEKHQLMATEGLQHISLQSLTDLLGDESFLVTDELNIFKAIVHWVRGDTKIRVDLLKANLIGLVRYLLIDSESKRIEILNDPILNLSPEALKYVQNIYSNKEGIDEDEILRMSTPRHAPEFLYIYYSYDKSATAISKSSRQVLDTDNERWARCGFEQGLDRNYHILFRWHGNLYSMTCMTGHLKRFNPCRRDWDYCELDRSVQDFMEYQENLEVKRVHVDKSFLYVIYTTTQFRDHTVTHHICRYDLFGMKLTNGPIDLLYMKDCNVVKQSVVIDDKFYMIHQRGVIRVKSFQDDATNTWVEIETDIGPEEDYTCIARDKKIYLLGGRIGGSKSNRCRIFDIETEKWSDGPDMSQARALADATIVDGSLMVVGGADEDNDKKHKQCVEYLDKDDKSWKTITFVPFKGYYFRCIAIPKWLPLYS